MPTTYEDLERSMLEKLKGQRSKLAGFDEDDREEAMLDAATAATPEDSKELLAVAAAGAELKLKYLEVLPEPCSLAEFIEAAVYERLTDAAFAWLKKEFGGKA